MAGLNAGEGKRSPYVFIRMAVVVKNGQSRFAIVYQCENGRQPNVILIVHELSEKKGKS